ncbi:hypothetical protein PPACK8108_LOCUS440 [Phakopsora pachyrhizi]|uniref:Zinc finger double-stranded RNA binding domain-containing protein n=1 Tax=Phakopsora pachyrhizi TaxID=170000 RepID=A0AAV0AG07_PHAPC|nr:hypothetical protein PPACK8108_LOCUS440 [Phakopsora pachyrhizi]
MSTASKPERERHKEAQRLLEHKWQHQDSNDPTDLLSLTDGATTTSLVVEDEVEEDVDIMEKEPEKVNDLYCVACGRNLNSQGAWENHERSRSTSKNHTGLSQQIIKEDGELMLSGCTIPSDTREQSEEPNLTTNYFKDQAEPEKSLG